MLDRFRYGYPNYVLILDFEGKIRNMYKKIINRLLNIYLIISVFTILFLGVCLETREPKCEREHLDDIDRTKDVIPDAETAKRLVEIFFYREDAGIMRMYEHIEYNVDVDFDEQKYQWIVSFMPKKLILDANGTAWVSRDKGVIMDISR